MAPKPAGTDLIDAVRSGDAEAVRALIDNGADVNASQGDGFTALHWVATTGVGPIAQMLLTAGARVDLATRNGAYTPLHVASRSGHHAVIEMLLRAGADPNRRTANGSTALHLAALSDAPAAISALVDGGAEVDAREAAAGQTPLIFAASGNHLRALRALLAMGADFEATTQVVDIVARASADAEDRAERNERMQATREQADSADVEQEDSVAAAEEEDEGQEDGGDARQGEQSEGSGASASVRPLAFEDLVLLKGGMTPLLHAARQGHELVVEALLDAGAEIDRASADGTTPLLIATINGHWDLAMSLLERGADPNLAAHSGVAPLYATINLRWAAKAQYPQPTRHMYQQVEYLDYVRALLEAGADPNVRLGMRLWFDEYGERRLVDTSGATPFWRAAYALDVTTMRMLVEFGADPTIPSIRPPERESTDSIDHSGHPPVPVGGPSLTALHVATGAGHGDLIGSSNTHTHVPGGWMRAARYLVEEIGLDVNARDHRGLTPLHGAAGRGDLEMIRYLIDQGADPTLKARNGDSTADYANSRVRGIPSYPLAIELLRSLGSDFKDDCAHC